MTAAKGFKLALTLGMMILVGILGWSAIAPLPTAIQPILKIAQVIVTLHFIEAIVGAALIFRYRQQPTPLPEGTDSMLLEHLPESLPAAVVKSGLYTFFMGAVGLSEILKGTGIFPSKQEV